jgi:hypothetical protein
VKGPRSFYLPHYGVFNPNKPGKLRLAYDAVAKSSGVSLNDALHTGPGIMNPLQAVMWRFREKQIAFTGDITDMFHRVLIISDERDSQRFLWRRLDRSKPPDTYVMKVV